jgi:hypothetical protein
MFRFNVRRCCFSWGKHDYMLFIVTTMVIHVCFFFLPFLFMFLMVFGAQCVVVGWCTSCCCLCPMFIAFLLLHGVVLFMPNAHHVVVATKTHCVVTIT